MTFSINTLFDRLAVVAIIGLTLATAGATAVLGA